MSTWFIMDVFKEDAAAEHRPEDKLFKIAVPMELIVGVQEIPEFPKQCFVTVNWADNSLQILRVLVSFNDAMTTVSKVSR